MKESLEIFSNNIKVLRKFHNMKQIDLQQRSEIPRSTISYYETGKSEPTLTPLINLSNAFNIDVDDLIKVRLSNKILKFSSTNIITHNMSASIFFSNLKKFRSELELSINKLANNTGVRYSNLLSYENGSSEPTLSSLLKISSFFNISIAKLISSKMEYIENTE